MTKQKQNILITLALPLTGILVLLERDRILALTHYFPSCFVYSNFHIYCPACGNTRSISSLLQGDLIASLHYNITPVLLLLLMAAAYFEFAFASFGKPIKLLPRKLWFYMVLIGLLVIYYIARNLSPVLAI